jgi:hypothetical protein
MVKHPLPAAAAPPPESDDELPVTVPIRVVNRDIRPLDDLSAKESAGVDVTPAVRVPVRLLAHKTVDLESAGQAKLIVSPARRVTAHPAALPPGCRPRLRVLRGLKLNHEYPIYEGVNYLGRRDNEPIDIDLEDQEPADRIWTSRKHAAIHFLNGVLEIEDLNSLNGTFVNRTRVAPGHRRALAINDIVQVGTIQMRILA